MSIKYIDRWFFAISFQKIISIWNHNKLISTEAVQKVCGQKTNCFYYNYIDSFHILSSVLCDIIISKYKISNCWSISHNVPFSTVNIAKIYRLKAQYVKVSYTDKQMKHTSYWIYEILMKGDNVTFKKKHLGLAIKSSQR